MTGELTPAAFLAGKLLEQARNATMPEALLILRALAAETTDKQLATTCRDRASEIEATLHKLDLDQLQLRSRALKSS